MIKVIIGKEPYLIKKEKESSIPFLSCPDFNLGMFTTFDRSTSDFLSSYPFMDEKKIAVLDCNQLSELDTPEFKEYLKNQVPYVDVVAVIRNVDKRVKFYKELEKEKCIVSCDKADMNTLNSFIQEEIQREGGSITPSALKLMVERVHYEREDINLFTIKNFILDLVTYQKEVTDETVMYLVPNNETDNVFSLIKLLNQKNVDGLRHQTELLQASGTGAIPTLSLLHREFRIASKIALFGESCKKELGVSYVNVVSRDITYLKQCLMLITNRIKDIQTGHIQEKDALLITMLGLVHLSK